MPWRALVCAGVVAVAAVGCAARRPVTVADRFVTHGEPSIDLGGSVQALGTAEYVAQLRALAAEARPRAKSTSPEALESRDPRLKDALAVLLRAPSAAAHKAVALEYRRLGVPDAAFTHLSAAIRLDPKDPTAYDLRARLWRAWGLPGLGIADARRAVALAPQSATAWNTLGLLLEGHGDAVIAVRAYLRAIHFDRQAGYAWSNLCRAWTTTGEERAALDACRRALTLDPTLWDAQVTLAQAEQRLDTGNGQRRRSTSAHTAAATSR
ncbi:MAG: hypothetical protein AB7N65_12980 [Vicinamibacterales bacterium]